MPVLPILTYPNKMLRKKANLVKIINSQIIETIEAMKETLIEAAGIGLAANQVGILKRIIVLNIPDPVGVKAYVNPEILERKGRREVSEGCLSFPGYTGLVNRSILINVRSLDENGGRIKFNADQLFAQAVEHEIDHLDGILFIDHLKEHEKLIESGKDENIHYHNINVEVEIYEDHKDINYNEKLYTNLNIEDMKNALSRAKLVKDLTVN